MLQKKCGPIIFAELTIARMNRLINYLLLIKLHLGQEQFKFKFISSHSKKRPANSYTELAFLVRPKRYPPH